jgi:tetratricopeptide (TPR) repeat protein
MINRVPGIREDSPEYIASLSYFSEKLGRQGGKLDYLLHVLKERRHHHVPRLPADLIHLASLAAELGDQQSALHYYNQALQMRPQDQRLQAMRMQVLMARHDWGNLLKTLESSPQTPATALEMAKIYAQRQQYEGAVAVLSNLLQNNPSQPEAMLLLAQSYRGLGDNQQALQTLNRLESQGQTSETVLMAKAQVLEAMDDRAGSQTAYEQVIQQAPDAQTAKVAQARLDRSRGNWAAAYQHLAQALANAPQDIELLNELEYIRGRMRPQREARNLPYWRGERRPEEKFRPWQFGRYDREASALGGSRAYPEALLPVQLPYAFRPETTVFSDSNNLRGLQARLSGGFWLGKVLPINIAVEYRQYQQQNTFFSGPSYNLGLARVFSQSNYVASRLRRAEISLGAGPLSLGDRFKISGEVIGRRYWKEVKRRIGQQGQVGRPVLTSVTVQNNFLVDYNYQSQGFNARARGRATEKDQANRLLGSMSLDIRAGHSTDVTLKYSRRDLFDQDSNIYPRLYQSVLNLAQTRFTTLNQMELSYNHQFKPGLDWRGSVGGALYSDQNQRLTFYQGLRWQAVNQPRMHLDLTPHYYLATYSQRRQAYFTPREYQAIGLGVDFDRQLFRLPTLILQGTFQMVDNQGRWGPALQGVIGLEQELLQNFYTGVHFFYFREFVDNYRLTSVSLGLRWLF